MASRLTREAESVLRSEAVFRGGRFDWIIWNPPKEGWVKINTDGAKKSSTGLASVGGLLRDHRGNWIKGFTIKIGDADSFSAELWGLREGLRLAREGGFERIVVETDSELAFKILTRDQEQEEEANTLIRDCIHLSKG